MVIVRREESLVVIERLGFERFGGLEIEGFVVC